MPCGVMPNDMPAGQLALGDQRPLAGGRVHPVDVRGRQDLFVADIGALIESHGPLAVRGDIELPHRLVRELDEPLRRDVERLAEGEVAVLFGADHLEGLDPLVARVPDVDIGRLVRGLARRVGRRHLLLDPEEHPLVVLAPGEGGPVADDPALRKAVRLRRFENNRRGQRRRRPSTPPVTSGKATRTLSFSRIFSTSLPLSTATAVPVFAPGEPAVVLGVVVERRDAPVARIEDEDAVAVLHGGIHGKGEKLAGAIEGEVADAPEQAGDVRSSGPAGWRRALAARADGAVRRGAAARRCGAAAASRPVGPAVSAAAAPEDQMGGRRGEGEDSDVLPGPNRSGFQVAQLDAPRRDRLRALRRGRPGPAGRRRCGRAVTAGSSAASRAAVAGAAPEPPRAARARWAAPGST